MELPRVQLTIGHLMALTLEVVLALAMLAGPCQQRLFVSNSAEMSEGRSVAGMGRLRLES